MPEKITFTVNSDGLDATLTNIHEVLVSNQKTTLEHHTALDNLNLRMSEIKAMLKSLQIQESARITSSPAQLQIQQTKQVPQVKYKEVQTINSKEDSTLSTVSCDSLSDSSNPGWELTPAKVDSATPWCQDS